jgi:hypothetical protein
LTSASLLLFVATQTPAQPKDPIIVRLIEPPTDPTGGLGEVLVGALGLTGVLVAGAALLGVVMAAALFWFRSRSA